MDIGAILVGLSILALSIVYVANPFLTRQTPAKVKLPQKKPGDLKAERLAVLATLKDLEFDHQTGKVAEEDYSALRAQLLTEAASLLPEKDVQDDDLEALIQTHREKLSQGSTCKQCGARLVSGDLYCSTCGSSVKSLCSGCGKELPEQARFCSFCGKSTDLEAKQR
jgi:ribosomal protein L40E